MQSGINIYDCIYVHFKLWFNVLLNAKAQTYLKLHEYRKCLEVCDKVVKVDLSDHNVVCICMSCKVTNGVLLFGAGYL